MEFLLASILVTVVFLVYSIYFKNENFKNFFFLMCMLFTFVTFTISSVPQKTILNCFEEGGQTICEEKKELGGQDAIIFSLGMVLLIVFIFSLINILLKAAEMWEV